LKASGSASLYHPPSDVAIAAWQAVTVEQGDALEVLAA